MNSVSIRVNPLSMSPVVKPARYSVDIRDFPKGFTDSDEVSDSVIRGLQNCVNLQSCSWTRDGSLTSEILRALHGLPCLEKLEINGHHQGNYDQRELVKFTHLNAVTIIMPSHSVIATLASWFMATGNTLTRLTLICKVGCILSALRVLTVSSSQHTSPIPC